MDLFMAVAVTDLSTRVVPQDIAQAAGSKGNGKQHWRVMRRIMQWAQWMDRCEFCR